MHQAEAGLAEDVLLRKLQEINRRFVGPLYSEVRVENHNQVGYRIKRGLPLIRFLHHATLGFFKRQVIAFPSPQPQRTAGYHPADKIRLMPYRSRCIFPDALVF
jgi:hypothetical protein